MNNKNRKWVEIIRVRLSRPEYGAKIREIFKDVSSGKGVLSDEKIDMALYVSTSVETDWSLYLYGVSWPAIPSGTRLGLNLVEAFRALGLVNHSVWILEDLNKDNEPWKKKL